jgi:hypothetical protein
MDTSVVVSSLVKSLVSAIAAKDMFSAAVCLTRLNELGINEKDLITKGYINVISTKKTVEPSVRKKSSSSKPRRSTRRN